MTQIDTGLIGSVINALPLDRMISGPLQAMITAQVQASKAYADFLMSVCIQDGKAVSVQFDYDETLVDENGVYQGTVTKKMRIPLLAAISHPNITVEEGTIDFELTINQMAEALQRMEAMRQEGINPTFHYVPLHSSIGGRRFAARANDCPVTTDVSDRLMRMPFFNGLTDAQLGRVVESFGRATRAVVG